ncbi:hypothetical protein VCR4J2_750006 [Vibrio coralliirubri]|nr:hypothetical protein VCR4J2_750006 [Vibrio coralliirubri]
MSTPLWGAFLYVNLAAIGGVYLLLGEHLDAAMFIALFIVKLL